MINTTFDIVMNKAMAKIKVHQQTLLKPFSITPDEFAILHIVSVHAGAVQKEIAKQLQKDQSRITRMVDKLESLGYVARQMDPEDRRAFKIVLEEKGREVHEALSKHYYAYEEVGFQGFESYEREMLVRLIERFCNNLDGQL